MCDSTQGVLLHCAICPKNYHKRCKCLNPPLTKYVCRVSNYWQVVLISGHIFIIKFIVVVVVVYSYPRGSGSVLTANTMYVLYVG